MRTNNTYIFLMVFGLITIFAENAYALDRWTVDTPEGQQSCLVENNALTECVPIVGDRLIVDTPDGQLSCLWDVDQYVDCIPAEDALNEASITQADPLTSEADTSISAQPKRASSETNAASDTVTQEATSSSTSEGHLFAGNTPNGLTYGFTFGWFGQVSDGKSQENGFSFGGNLGFKYNWLGLSLDMDFSVNPTEKQHENIWTYSFSALLMGYIPFADDIMQTIGFGIGYTGWSLDYEYTEYSLDYDWWTGYYVTENNYDEVIDSGGFLSLKLKARLDFIFDEFTLGLEVDWIPWLDIDNQGKIVNNIVGLQIHLGGFKMLY